MIQVTIYNADQHRQFELVDRCLRIAETGSTLPDFDGLDSVDLEFEMTEDSVSIFNEGATADLPWLNRQLPPQSQIETELPVLIRVGQAYIEIQASKQEDRLLREARKIARSRGEDGAPRIPVSLLGESPGSATLASWFESLGLLQRKTAESKELLTKSLEAVINPGGLDSCLLLVKEDTHWQIKASVVPNPSNGIGFAPQLIQQVIEDQITIFHELQEAKDGSNALTDSIVAAPIIGPNDEVEAVLYAVRSIHGNNQRRCIRPLEAIWVQLVAESISAGVIRLQAEADAARTRVLFEQAFSGRVVRELVDNPDILSGQELEISVLFADLREFSSISERLGTGDTYTFLGDLLEHLTDCVMNEGGVIIDYYGDGLAAMWNAPTRQRDHAERACRAALQMVEGLPLVSNRWKDRIEGELQIGIGINTGIAQVGNAGTKRRMKYGPRGTTVNIASRVETATKRVGTPILITGQTNDQLAKALTPRVGRAKLKGISDPIDLYQLVSLSSHDLAQDVFRRIELHQKILALYESGNLEEALRLVEQSNAGKTVAPSYAEQLCDKFLYEHLASNDLVADDVVFDLSGIPAT